MKLLSYDSIKISKCHGEQKRLYRPRNQKNRDFIDIKSKIFFARTFESYQFISDICQYFQISYSFNYNFEIEIHCCVITYLCEKNCKLPSYIGTY